MVGLLSKNELLDVLQMLTSKQRHFCEEYIIDFNGKRAAEAAGYSNNAASVTASTILTYPNVQLYLNHLKAQRSEETGVQAADVVREMAKIAFHRIDDFIDFDGQRAKLKAFDDIKHPGVIKKVKITTLKRDGADYGYVSEIELYDKLKALDALGRHTAIFTDNINLTSNGKELPAAQVVTNVVINHRRKGELIDRSDEQKEDS